MNKIIQILYCGTFLFLYVLEMQHLVKQLSCNKLILHWGGCVCVCWWNEGSLFYLKVISVALKILWMQIVCAFPDFQLTVCNFRIH